MACFKQILGRKWRCVHLLPPLAPNMPLTLTVVRLENPLVHRYTVTWYDMVHRPSHGYPPKKPRRTASGAGASWVCVAGMRAQGRFGDDC